MCYFLGYQALQGPRSRSLGSLVRFKKENMLKKLTFDADGSATVYSAIVFTAICEIFFTWYPDL